MTFIELVEKDDAPADVLAVYEQGEAAYGQVLETWKALAHNGGILQAYLPFLRAVFGPGALPQRVKDLVALRCCYLNGCRYSLSHRVFSARNQGIPDGDIVGVADPERHAFSDAEQTALAFATELTVNPAQVPYSENPQAVSTATLAAVKSHFSDAEISELTVSVGVWNWLTRFHRVMDFPLDMPPPPEGLDVG